jgi:hypothetical protein
MAVKPQVGRATDLVSYTNPGFRLLLLRRSPGSTTEKPAFALLTRVAEVAFQPYPGGLFYSPTLAAGAPFGAVRRWWLSAKFYDLASFLKLFLKFGHFGWTPAAQ